MAFVAFLKPFIIVINDAIEITEFRVCIGIQFLGPLQSHISSIQHKRVHWSCRRIWIYFALEIPIYSDPK